MTRVDLRSDEELDRAYPGKWGAIVEVKTKDGRILSQKVEYAKGEPQNPLSRQEFSDKFISLTEAILPIEESKSMLGRILELEGIEKVGQLFEPPDA
jgi:2-methylcitrate dehydratase PrpD